MIPKEVLLFYKNKYKMKNKQKDPVEELFTIIKNSKGLTITELVVKSPYSRSSVRTYLAMLEGAKRITYRSIGMAKVYSTTKKTK